MPSLLDQHLTTWLGQWPPSGPLTIVTAPGRTEPGWDGKVHDVVGVASPEGTVLSVPPAALADARRLARAGGLEALGAVDAADAAAGDGQSAQSAQSPQSGLGALLGRPTHRLHRGTFRWTETPVGPDELPDAGIWLPAGDPRVPEWLRPFGDPVLIALDPETGTYAAGVGIKRHDHYGHELAVGTEERFRGRGLARRLTAQAARHVIAEGRVATYLHDPNNTASAKVAEAAGFPDRGWKILGLWP